MLLFSHGYSCALALSADAPEAVRIAALDLQADLRRISGQKDGFELTDSADGAAIIIDTVPGASEETYEVRAEGERVYITGTDVLGTVFGIYAFAEKFLGILPICKVAELFPPCREELVLPEAVISSGARSCRFRGWFLNDEDLLTDFHEGGGRRDIDYPYYQNVMAGDVLELILETALRMEINLIIPSSFVDIDNPAEEKLIQAAVRRGLYVSQHHVEPVGVSFFAADAYMKKHGEPGEEVSFVSNRRRMEEIWRYYIEKWAVYGKSVIWQLGLRGKGDRAVWQNDPNVPLDDAARGALITDAIASQHRMIAETLGTDDFLSTATLWMEGAELYGNGHLRIPDGTITVFSDIGYTQMFGDDFYRIRRLSGQKYGIYYHIGYVLDGPHLAEGSDIEKMAFSYREAEDRQSLYYSIVNVTNVRPVHHSAWYNAELMKDCRQDGKALYGRLLEAIYGAAAAKVAPLMEEYYACVGDLGVEETKYRCDTQQFYYHDYGRLDYPLLSVTDGVIRTIGLRMMQKNKPYTVDDENLGRVLEESLARWDALYIRMEAALDDIPAGMKAYYEQHPMYGAFYMRNMTRWLLFARAMLQAESAQARDAAYAVSAKALEDVLERRVILEQGMWENWHRGDKKINVPNLLNVTRETYEALKRGDCKTE